jgi:hypothetical protein
MNMIYRWWIGVGSDDRNKGREMRIEIIELIAPVGWYIDLLIYWIDFIFYLRKNSVNI